LIDATITIDGRPFLMARERRIQQILEDAAKPAPEVTQPPAETDAVVDAVGTESAPAATPDNEDTAGDSVSDEDASEESSESEADSASEDDPAAADEEATEKTEPEEEPVASPTVPEYSLPTTVAERVRRFVAATGEAATVDEVRWLLTNWVDGPVLLMLNDNFQRFRANQRPVFNVLDADRDGTISAGELANSVAAFEKCDFNRNDIVEYTELARVASNPEPRKSKHSGPGKLIFRIPDESSAVAMYRRIAARYPTPNPGDQPLLPRFDVNANGKLDADELAVLKAAKPDLSFTIAFNTKDSSTSRIEVTAAGSTLSGSSANAADSTGSIDLLIGGTTVSFSAVQSGKSDQISIGAVNDGYPILPVIDPNEDGRFTIRERRGLIDSLLKFDKNLDGSLSNDETQATIRVCFGLGPHVHRELVALRQVNPNSRTPVVTGPDWFVRMDRNGDNDVSSNEFPGKKEHFADLDTDRDALISAQEALDYDERNSKPASDSKPTVVAPPDKTTEETVTETESSI
jgi:Ca2+-binding EF-hand superfamily protein